MCSGWLVLSQLGAVLTMRDLIITMAVILTASMAVTALVYVTEWAGIGFIELER